MNQWIIFGLILFTIIGQIIMSRRDKWKVYILAMVVLFGIYVIYPQAFIGDDGIILSIAGETTEPPPMIAEKNVCFTDIGSQTYLQGTYGHLENCVIKKYGSAYRLECDC